MKTTKTSERIARAWREFWCPRLKCIRLGHQFTPTLRLIRRRSSEGRRVATDYHAIFRCCKRCGKESGPHKEVEVDWWSSCSMPDSMWDDIKRQGYVVIK